MDPSTFLPRHRYNAATSDANHVRLLERRSRAYTCRELMCIVFLPCLLICLLGIACSALVIYYQLDKVSRFKGVKDGLGRGGCTNVGAIPGPARGPLFPLLIGGRERGRGGVDQCLSWGGSAGEGIECR